MTTGTNHETRPDATKSPLDRKVTITLFPDQYGLSKTEKRLTFRQLPGLIESAYAVESDDLPYWKMGAFGEEKTKKNCYRHDANMLTIEGVEIDYDGGPTTPMQARGILAMYDLPAVVYTTPRHGVAGNRWRALLPCSTSLSPDRRHALVARVKGILDDGVDDASFNRSQGFKYGNVRGRPPATVYVVEGDTCIDLADDLDRTAKGRSDRKDREPGEGTGEKTGRPFETIREALFAIPNDGSNADVKDRQQWLEIGMALHFETDGGEVGFDAFDEWSQQHPTYDADATRTAWESFTDGKGGRSRTGRHILALARKHGWQDIEGEAAKFRDLPDEDEDQPDAAPLFKSASAFAGVPVPPREWHVQDLIPHKNVTLLSGDGGVGKSLLALQLAVAAAADSQWIGHDVKRPGPVFYLSAEDDDDELHRRLADIAKSQGLDFADLGNLHIRSTVGEESLLATFNRKTGKIVHTDLFRRLADALTKKPALLVLDTLANLHTGEEVSRTVAQQFINAMRALAIEHECAVLLLMHPSLSGMASGSGTSGSTTWSNAVRSRMYLTRCKDDNGQETDTDKRILQTMKTNYAATGGQVTLWWHKGVFVPEIDHEGETPTDRARRVFVKLLDIFAKQGRRVSPNPGSTYAPAIFAKHPDREKCSNAMFTEAMNTLLQEGVIVSVDHGRPGKPGQHLGRGENDLFV